MDPRLAKRIEAAISQATGKAAKVAREEVAGGSSIGETRRLRLEDGRGFFLKSLPPGKLQGIFAAETAGLAALRGAGVLPVPRVVAQAEDFLLLELIEVGTIAAPDFFESFGRDLARLKPQPFRVAMAASG